MGKRIKASFQTITFPECCDIVERLLRHFWESKIDKETVSRIQADWFRVLQKHSKTTVETVSYDWLSTGKRKPTPADILELCNETDQTPNQLERLRRIYELPVKDHVNDSYADDGKMLGCPIVLARIMKSAEEKDISFPENEQMNYLSNGVMPPWYVPSIDIIDRSGMPSRDELLAQMSPEARLSAIKDDRDWLKK